MTAQTLRGRCRSERGAAALEFAIVLPILILFVFGIIEFGRVYNAQITLSAAAREGARVMAIENDPVAARDVTVAAAPGLNPALTTGQVAITPATCTPGDSVTVAATYPLNFITSFIGTSVTLTGRGVMRCGG